LGNKDAENSSVGVTRRSIFAGLFAGAVIGPVAAEAAVDPYERVRQDAEALAASMKAMHGGEWTVRVSHERRYVAVSRDLS
jgi:hypothetical protein